MLNLNNNIIGSGFLAKNFINHKTFFKKKNFFLYVAGVSNSLSANNLAYKKDYNRIKKFLKSIDNQKLIYISSCSRFDPNRNTSKYIKNKIKIENLIKKKKFNYLIIRLPEIVGNSKNKYTLTNFFYNNLKNNTKFKIMNFAKRNLLDISDVVKLIIFFLKKKIKVKEINLANFYYHSPIDIVLLLEKILKKKGNYQFDKKKLKNWKIRNSITKEILNKNKVKLDKNYLSKILKKYYNK